MRADRGSSVVAASYRLQSLQAAAEEVLPALGAATNATLAFIHHTDPDDRQTVVTWPPSRGELLARYTQDYVAECPFVPVKMAARESVVPITRRLSRRQVTHNAFYADLLRPAALHHHVELRLEPSEQGLPRTAIILGRDEAAGEFDDRELATLASVRLALSGAMRRVVDLDHARDRIAALEAMLTMGGSRSVRLAVDADGREVHLHSPADATDPALIAELRNPSHPLRRLARDVARGVAVSEHADAARVAFHNGTSSFLADVGLVPPTPGQRPLAILTLTPTTAVAPRPAATAWNLSPTESAVLREIVVGGSNQEIGKRLFISPETVRTHLTRIYRKMGVRSRLEAAALARST